MPLEPDQSLLHYRIAEKIGEGGMGAVWRAHDTTLDRQVAIKVLPQDFAEDPERLARFEREAKLLASLNHPNIAAIYGLHQVDPSTTSGQAEQPIHFLAMELVEGEDLSQRLARGPLPIEDALDYADQICHALEAAHDNGVIHRDLKPANIQLTPEGKIKVLDFGLAKAYGPGTGSGSASASLSPTMTSAGTVAGVLLGTAAYMSPEQARGKPVDKRADVWAFGCVLYEMLTGRTAFEGESITDVLASVIKEQPDFGALPPDTPPAVRRVLERSLEKDVRRRRRDIGDARIELEERADASDQRAEATTTQSRARPAAATWAVIAAVVAVALAAGFLIGSWRNAPSDSESRSRPATRRFSIPAPAQVDAIWNPVVSPDGSFVVYEGYRGGKSDLYVHELDAFEARLLPGTESASNLFISPDGRWIGFVSGTDLVKVQRSGGDVVKICEVGGGFPGASWGLDGTIVFPGGWLRGLLTVTADGGEPAELTSLNTAAGEKGHWWPRFLPDGRHVLFTVWSSGAGLIDSDVALLDVSTGEYRALFRGAAAWFLPPRHIVYYRAGTYHAIAFDLERLEVTGDPVQVLDDAADPVPQGDNYLALSVSGEGTLVYGAFQPIPRSHLAWVEPGHEPRRLDLPPGSITSVAISPDGREAAVASLESGVFVIHLLDLTTGTHERVDVDGSNWEPLWKPDGSGFAFLSLRKGDFDIYFKDARTRGPEQPIVVGETDESPLGWTLDGRGILANETQPDGSSLVRLFPADGSDRESETILDAEGVNAASISPDGRWLAFSSSRGGKHEVYVKPYGSAGSGPEVRVSRRGGQRAAWSPDGSELYYTRGHAIVALGYEVDGDRFVPGEEQVLFESPLLFDYSGHPLATVGRRRFLVTLREEPPGGEHGRPEVRVVLNWQLEVEEAFAEARR